MLGWTHAIVQPFISASSVDRTCGQECYIVIARSEHSPNPGFRLKQLLAIEGPIVKGGLRGGLNFPPFCNIAKDSNSAN